jgi:hypothetical protein
MGMNMEHRYGSHTVYEIQWDIGTGISGQPPFGIA